MDQYNLANLGQKLKIATEHIIREYYEMVILQTISENSISKSLMFYGGTALRLAYNGPRFSEDLDFLMMKKITEKELRALLEGICIKYPQLNLVEVKDKRNTLFALLKIQHSSLKHPRHIKIEICKKENGVKSEYRLLFSQCCNFTPLIQTITLDSLEKAKIDAIKGRQESRDWVDLWFIANLSRKPFEPPDNFPFESKEFKRELKRFLPIDKWLVIDEILKSIKAKK